MLLERLEQTKQQASRARTRLAFLFFIFALAVVLFLLDVIIIDLSQFGLGTQSIEPANSAQPPSVEQTSRVSSSEKNGLKVVRREPVEADAPVEKPQINTPDKRTIPESRNKFKIELAEFEDGLRPKISNEAFSHWNKKRQQEILKKIDDAIITFGSGNYEEALTSLRGAADIARTELDKRDVAFNKTLAKAKSSQEEDDYNSASLNIAEAIRLKPGATEALKLKEQIDQLPALLSLIEMAAVARTENNLEAEENYLKQVLNVDPWRTEIKSRLRFVAQKIKELKFNKHIETGLASINQRNFSLAQSHLKNAYAIFDKRPETDLLSKKLAALARELETERLISEARSASQSDDWITAEKLYEQANNIIPNYKEAIDGYSLSRKIVSFNDQLLHHLQASQRLASTNVAKLVRGLVDEAQTVAFHSRSLSEKVEKLSVLLKAYAAKVLVQVISDGTTNITVRGVGRVGKVMEKKIKLRPGRYTFEGVRPGHKSKLIEVHIPPGTERTVVEIYCDERI